jgi:hypothetical protein
MINDPKATWTADIIAKVVSIQKAIVKIANGFFG